MAENTATQRAIGYIPDVSLKKYLILQQLLIYIYKHVYIYYKHFVKTNSMFLE